MDHVDYSFILRLGSRLELFSEVRRGLFRCRCPFCGDSKKRKNLSRLYIFETPESARAYCHNCGFSGNVAFLLKSIDGELFKEYRLEKFGSKARKDTRQIENKSQTFTQRRFQRNQKEQEIYQLPSCFPASEIAASAEFLQRRHIPEHLHKHLFYMGDIAAFVSKFNRYENLKISNIPCIAIPFYINQNEIPPYVMVRSLGGKFFMNLEIGEGPKIWGLPHLNTSDALCFEAPIDAMMVDGGVSMSGIHLAQDARQVLKSHSERTILVFDNDYRKNKSVKNALKQAIDSNDWVVVYDNQFRWKDANDCICSGAWSSDQLREYLIQRTFRGARAKLELARWAL